MKLKILFIVFSFFITCCVYSDQIFYDKLSDDELKQALDDILKPKEIRRDPNYEQYLGEVIRRGGKQWESFLAEKLEFLKSDGDLNKYTFFSLELLTALRRIKKQPDPLHIFIQEPKSFSGLALQLPELKVRIENVDIEKTKAGLTFGGNYRSGRQARWRILLQDEKGNALPIKDSIGSGTGGGMYQEGILEYGKSWETSLSVQSFIEKPPPGKYKLTVLYHNTIAIADRGNIDDLIVYKSDSIPFTIKPITITCSKKDQKLIIKLVSEIDDKKSLKMVVGTYDEWAYELIAPDSPEGKLLSMGIKATPTIIHLLHDKTLSNEKRAWLFAILFSLTGENDPRRFSALGSYEYWESGFEIWGGLTGEEPSGGLSLGSQGSVSMGKINKKDQDDLLKTWDLWLEMVELKKK